MVVMEEAREKGKDKQNRQELRENDKEMDK